MSKSMYRNMLCYTVGLLSAMSLLGVDSFFWGVLTVFFGVTFCWWKS